MADRRHNFTIFPQSYKYGCWLAATHSMNMYNIYWGYYSGMPWPVSLYDNSVNYHDSWLGQNQGLLMDSGILTEFASRNRLQYQRLYGDTSVVSNKIILSPVMVAGRLAGSGNDSHFFVITGVKNGKVYWSDPKPDGQASMGVTTFADFKKTHPNAFEHAFWWG
ncbi:hypothetical protein GCM10027341_17870 [Spirosoma knui]